MKLGTFSEVAAIVEREGFRGLEFTWRGKGTGRKVVFAWDGYWTMGPHGPQPYSPSRREANAPCWRATNDL